MKRLCEAAETDHNERPYKAPLIRAEYELFSALWSYEQVRFLYARLGLMAALNENADLACQILLKLLELHKLLTLADGTRIKIQGPTERRIYVRQEAPQLFKELACHYEAKINQKLEYSRNFLTDRKGRNVASRYIHTVVTSKRGLKRGVIMPYERFKFLESCERIELPPPFEYFCVDIRDKETLALFLTSESVSEAQLEQLEANARAAYEDGEDVAQGSCTLI